jgi:hypothetical protein
VNGAVLAIRGRPALLDRLDQPRGAVGDDHHRRPEPTGDQVPAQRKPVLVGLAHPQADPDQDALALLREPPGAEHALLRALGSDVEEDRVEEEGHQPDLVEVAARERLKALPQLGAEPRGGRLGELAQPRLLTKRLDVSHREPADEGTDDHRLQGLGAKQLRRMREQRRDERLRGLADLRNLDSELALRGLQPPGAIAVSQSRVEVAKTALVVGPALIAGAAEPSIKLVLDRALDDQASTELRQLRQRPARVLPHTNGQQLVDLHFYLRRWR